MSIRSLSQVLSIVPPAYFIAKLQASLGMYHIPFITSHRSQYTSTAIKMCWLELLFFFPTNFYRKVNIFGVQFHEFWKMHSHKITTTIRTQNISSRPQISMYFFIVNTPPSLFPRNLWFVVFYSYSFVFSRISCKSNHISVAFWFWLPFHSMPLHFTHVTIRAHSFLLSSTIPWYGRTTVSLFHS